MRPVVLACQYLVQCIDASMEIGGELLAEFIVYNGYLKLSKHVQDN